MIGAICHIGGENYMVNRDTLLISCGTHEGRAKLCAIFKNSYNLLEAANIYQTKMFLEQNSRCIAAVILDTTTFQEPDLNTIAEFASRASLPEEIPILAITSSHSPSFHEHLLELGATDIVISPYSPNVLQRQLQTLLDLNLYKFNMEEFTKEQAYFFQRSNEAIMDTLSSIIEYRSLESGQHILRIRRFTEILLREVARSCPECNLDEETIQIISSASSLHDIGKISIPDSILNKPGPLTPEERLEMQTHTTVGYQILNSLSGSINDEYLHYARLICLYHHERWDGHGYPDGIKGDQIPLCAQVAGLADAYDALTSKRVYKDAYSMDKSVNMILNGECGVFSPKLLECFKQVTHEFAELAQDYHDGCELKYEPPALVQTPPADQRGLDTLQLLQSKYQSMLHYMGATVLEINLDDSTYHIVYNPDPNLLVLNTVTSVRHLTQITMESLVIPEELEQFKDVLYQQIPNFFCSVLRRQHHYFHIKSLNGDSQPLYRMTLLRIDPPDSTRRRMTVVVQLVDRIPRTSPTGNLDQDFLDFAVFGTLDTLYSVRRDTYLTLNRCSTDLLSLLGYTVNELESKYQNRMIELIHPNDRKRVFDSIDKQLSSGVDFLVEFRILPKTGDYIWVLNKGRLFTEHMGHEYLYCLMVDISKSKAAEEVLQQTLERQAIILSQTENVIFECDMDGNNAYFSDKWKEMFGYDCCSNIPERLHTDSHLHPDDIPLVFETLHKLQNSSSYAEIDIRIAKADGHYLWCQVRINVQRDQFNIPVKMVGVIINVDAKKRSVQALQNRAERDALTNLLNKDASKDYIESFLASSNNQSCSAMLVIDLDNFKQVNDQYGHMFGDIIIAQAAEEIQKLFRTDDVVGRIGGDEFIVLMKNIPSQDLLHNRLNSLITVFDTTLHNRVPEANLGCSIGVALYPQHGTNHNVLFRRADQALYKAKASGKNTYKIYETGSGSPGNSKKSSVANTPIDSNKKSTFTTDNLIQYTFQQLYTSGDIELTISNMLNLVGQRMNVSRVYIFENNADNTCCSNTFEWCNTGISAEMENLQNLDYHIDFHDKYQENFNDQGIFYCPDVSKLPKAQYDILAPQGIKSMLQCAIYDKGMFRGFVGFDECHSHRLWTQQQIDALSFFSEIISTFLLKKRAQDETERRAENLFSILENQNAWIYVIDSNTFEFLFVNKKTRSLYPQISTGERCYSCLMDLDSPCPNCPALGLPLHESKEEIIVNPILDLRVVSEATSIQWDGRNACLVTCREVKEIPGTK